MISQYVLTGRGPIRDEDLALADEWRGCVRRQLRLQFGLFALFMIPVGALVGLLVGEAPLLYWMLAMPLIMLVFGALAPILWRTRQAWPGPVEQGTSRR